MNEQLMQQALKRAFQLGQDYWYQADHESYRENKKSDETLAKFRQLVDETCEALAEPDFWAGYVPEPVKPAQQEPVAMWDGKYQIEFGNLSAYKDGEHSWIPLYTSPPAHRKPLTDEQQVAEALRIHGLTLVKTASGYEVLKLGQITAHGIKENNT